MLKTVFISGRAVYMARTEPSSSTEEPADDCPASRHTSPASFDAIPMPTTFRTADTAADGMSDFPAISLTKSVMSDSIPKARLRTRHEADMTSISESSGLFFFSSSPAYKTGPQRAAALRPYAISVQSENSRKDGRCGATAPQRPGSYAEQVYLPRQRQ